MLDLDQGMINMLIATVIGCGMGLMFYFGFKKTPEERYAEYLAKQDS